MSGIERAGLAVVELDGTSASNAVAVRTLLRADDRVSFALTGYRNPTSKRPILVLDELGVKFKEGAAGAGVRELTSAFGLVLLRSADQSRARYHHKFAFPNGSAIDPLAIALAVSRHPTVEYAAPNMISEVRSAHVPSDPLFALQFPFNNNHMLNGVPVDINVKVAWDFTMGGAPLGGQVVAVIDDGVQAANPDFGIRVEAGYDAFDLPGCPCANNPSGNDSHGTHVAGLIAAQHDNGIGIAGVAPAVWIYPVRILRGSQNPVFAGDEEAGEAIDVAWQLGLANVLNNSWGYNDPNYAGNVFVTSAIQRATTLGRGGKGAVVVFAAGNTSDRAGGHIGPVLYPATLPEVITVSAVNRFGAPTNYAPQGNAIDIVAPSAHDGETCVGEVVTLDLTGGAGCNPQAPQDAGLDADYTSTFAGTSAAAPQVSAAAALLISREPNLTYTQIRARLSATARPWGSTNTYGSGLLNVGGAVQAGLPAPLSASIGGPTTVKRNNQCTWNASVSGGMTPYIYKWTRNSILVGTEADLIIDVGTSSFTLDLEVADASGVKRSPSAWITVVTSGANCQA
ncbi:MAG: S8 family serine peptidase [Gemmatimonadota bacterium]